MRGTGQKRWLSTYRVEGAERSLLGTGHVVCRYGASIGISVRGFRLPV